MTVVSMTDYTKPNVYISLNVFVFHEFLVILCFWKTNRILEVNIIIINNLQYY